MGVYGAKVLAEMYFKEQENLKKIKFSTIEKFIKNESKRNIITGNGFTIGITSNKKNKSSFEFKNIHTRAEKIYKKHYSNDKILDTFPTINSYFIFLKKRMTNILLTFKLGEKAVGKKINPKIKTLKSYLESEVYEYIDNTLKSPLIIDRDDLFTFNHFLINEKWYFENIDSVLPILENEPKFLKNDFPLIIAIKYSYINSIWFKGRSIKSNLIKFKYNKEILNKLINEKVLTLNYDNFTNFIFEDKKCTNIHGSLKYLNIRDFKKDTLNKLEFNKNNYDFWKNKDLTNIMMTMMKFNDSKNEPKKLAYPIVSLGSVNNKDLTEETIQELENIQGSILIIGATFFNEWHILKILNKNENLKNIYYVYYGEKEKAFKTVLNSLDDFNKNIFLISSEDFYTSIKK